MFYNSNEASVNLRSCARLAGVLLIFNSWLLSDTSCQVAAHSTKMLQHKTAAESEVQADPAAPAVVSADSTKTSSPTLADSQGPSDNFLTPEPSEQDTSSNLPTEGLPTSEQEGKGSYSPESDVTENPSSLSETVFQGSKQEFQENSSVAATGIASSPVAEHQLGHSVTSTHSNRSLSETIQSSSSQNMSSSTSFWSDQSYGAAKSIGILTGLYIVCVLIMVAVRNGPLIVH